MAPNDDGEKTKSNLPKSNLKLKTFNGSEGTADLFWQKFKILAKCYKWTEEEKRVQLILSLENTAGSWFLSLPDDIASDWKKLHDAFEDHFLKNTPTLVTEQKLEALKHKPGEDLDLYYAQVLALGHKCGKTKE